MSETSPQIPDVLDHVDPRQFLLPLRADSFARPFEGDNAQRLADRGSFAQRQAEASTSLLQDLQLGGENPGPSAWRNNYFSVVDWRANLEVGPLETNPNANALALRDLLRKPVTDEDPNCDALLGMLPELRGPNGQDTPASLAFEHTAIIARQRFKKFEEAGVVVDHMRVPVELPDGSVVEGNLLERGEPARNRRRTQLLAKQTDPGQNVEPEQDIVFVLSANAAERDATFDAAMQLLSEQTPGELSTETLAQTAYYLFQSPQTKRGSDAIIRTFLTAAGTYLMGEPVVLPHDIDLLAFTMEQDEFVEQMAREIRMLQQGYAAQAPNL